MTIGQVASGFRRAMCAAPLFVSPIGKPQVSFFKQGARPGEIDKPSDNIKKRKFGPQREKGTGALAKDSPVIQHVQSTHRLLVSYSQGVKQFDIFVDVKPFDPTFGVQFFEKADLFAAQTALTIKEYDGFGIFRIHVREFARIYWLVIAQ